MARPIPVVDDYRKFILPKLAKREAEIFTKPSRDDLEVRASYYEPLVDRFVPADRAIEILELGSGWGAFLMALQGRGYTRIRAVEMVPECCALTRDYLGIEPACEDVFDYLARVDGPFDLVAAFDVIEHFTKNEIVALLQCVVDLLRPGGVLLVRVPNCSSLGGLNVLHSGFTHETGFTPTSIDELFRAVGLVDIECIPEPVFARTRVRTALKRALVRVVGEAVHLGTAGAIEAPFALVKNLVAAGRKP